jgi:hypothetical protein
MIHSYKNQMRLYELKNRTFAFLVKIFQNFFFQKSPIRGIFMREIDCTHRKIKKKRKVRFLAHSV